MIHESIVLFLSGVIILSVWAALGRGHWAVRVAVVMVPLAGLPAIRVGNVAFLPMIVAAAVMLLTSSVRYLRRVAETNAPSRSFAIRSTFAIILGLAVSFAIAVLLGPPNNPISWFEWTVFVTLPLGPAVLLLLSLPAAPSDQSQDGHGVASNVYRFKLTDVAIAFFFVGIAATIARFAAHDSEPITLSWLLGTTGGIVAISLSAVLFVLLERVWIYAAIGMLLSIILSTTFHARLIPDWAGLRDIAAFQNTVSESSVATILLAHLLLVTSVISFVYLLAVSSAFPTFGLALPKRTGLIARLLLAASVIAVFTPIVVLVFRMIPYVPVPDYPFPEQNRYDELVAVAEDLALANPEELPVRTVAEHNMATGERIAKNYGMLSTILKDPVHVPFDIERDAYEGYDFHMTKTFRPLRGLARTLEKEGNDRAAAGEIREAISFGLMNLRLGVSQQSGGILVSSLTGMAIEAFGVSQLCRIRNRIPADQRQTIISILLAIDQNREPIAVSLQRDAAWSSRVFGWRHSLAREAPAFLAGIQRTHYYNPDESFYTTLQSLFDRRDAMVQLLVTDLAIQAFLAEKQRLPETLDELCPDLLEELPMDPFSNAPLIYRLDRDTFILYSVGLNRVDDGGRFGTYVDLMQGSFDLDLDINARSASASSAKPR